MEVVNRLEELPPIVSIMAAEDEEDACAAARTPLRPLLNSNGVHNENGSSNDPSPTHFTSPEKVNDPPLLVPLGSNLVARNQLGIGANFRDDGESDCENGARLVKNKFWTNKVDGVSKKSGQRRVADVDAFIQQENEDKSLNQPSDSNVRTFFASLFKFSLRRIYSTDDGEEEEESDEDDENEEVEEMGNLQTGDRRSAGKDTGKSPSKEKRKGGFLSKKSPAKDARTVVSTKGPAPRPPVPELEPKQTIGSKEKEVAPLEAIVGDKDSSVTAPNGNEAVELGESSSEHLAEDTMLSELQIIATDSWRRINKESLSLSLGAALSPQSRESSSESIFTDPLTPRGLAELENKAENGEDRPVGSCSSSASKTSTVSLQQQGPVQDMDDSSSLDDVTLMEDTDLEDSTCASFVHHDQSTGMCLDVLDELSTASSPLQRPTSFTLHKHRMVDLGSISSTQSTQEALRRHSSVSDVPVDSNVLRKVASLTLDKNTIDQKVHKPRFVPDKLDFQLYEKFEGQQLINWFVASFPDDHYLRLLLASQDLKILAAQFCTHMLAAGVLRQIPDKDAPIETLFRPDLMYFWSHTEAPAITPATPGRLSSSVLWPHGSDSTCSTPSGVRPGARYTEADNEPAKDKNNPMTASTGSVDKAIRKIETEEFQQVVMGLKREHKDNLTRLTRGQEVKMFTLRGEHAHTLHEYEETIVELQEMVKALRQELETQRTLADIQSLTEKAISDFESPGTEAKSIVSLKNESAELSSKSVISGVYAKSTTSNLAAEGDDSVQSVPVCSGAEPSHAVDESKLKSPVMSPVLSSSPKISPSKETLLLEPAIPSETEDHPLSAPEPDLPCSKANTAATSAPTPSQDDTPVVPEPDIKPLSPPLSPEIGSLSPSLPEMAPSSPLMSGIGPPPPPMPEMGPPPPPMPEMGPPPPTMPGIGPPSPPMLGMGPSPPPMPGIGPPPPPMSGIGPPPPPMPGMGPPPPPMSGIGPPPPPMPGMGPPPPPMPGMGPPPPPMPGMGPPPPPMPGMGPPPPPMPGMGPPPPPMPGMGPPPPPMAGMGPPPPPPGMPAGLPPPPPMGGAPMPLPVPPAGGWSAQRAVVAGGSGVPSYAALRKAPVNPAVPMKPLYWSRIVVPVGSEQPAPISTPTTPVGALWERLEEATIEDYSEFNELFSRQITQRKPTKKKNEETVVKQQTAKILDSKRSQNVGILSSSLHVDFSEIENAIYNLDTSVVNLEALHQIYEVRASDEELAQIKAHLQTSPQVPLDKPEQFLLELSDIPNFAERIACFMFQTELEDNMSGIESKLNNMKATCDMLLKAESVKIVMSVILTLGNYMNGGNMTRGQADGFGIEILPKLRDVKSKDSSVTLLHFIVRTVMRKTEDPLNTELVLPVPEPGDIARAAAVNFEEITSDLNQLERDLKVCERKTGKVIAASSEDNLQPFKDKMETFLKEGKAQIQGELENLEECKSRFKATVKYYHFKCKTDDDVKEFFSPWAPFCKDFKDIWKKEQARLIKEKMQELKRLQDDRKTETRPVKAGGLKDRMRQRLSQGKTS